MQQNGHLVYTLPDCLIAIVSCSNELMFTNFTELRDLSVYINDYMPQKNWQCCENDHKLYLHL